MCMTLEDPDESESWIKPSMGRSRIFLFLSTRTNPDNILARFAPDHRRVHEVAVEKAMRYLQGIP